MKLAQRTKYINIGKLTHWWRVGNSQTGVPWLEITVCSLNTTHLYGRAACSAGWRGSGDPARAQVEPTAAFRRTRAGFHKEAKLS